MAHLWVLFFIVVGSPVGSTIPLYISHIYLKCGIFSSLNMDTFIVGSVDTFCSLHRFYIFYRPHILFYIYFKSAPLLDTLVTIEW